MQELDVFYQLDSIYRKLARCLEETDAALDEGRWFELADITPVGQVPWNAYKDILERVAERKVPGWQRIAQELDQDVNSVNRLITEYREEKLSQNAPLPKKEDWLHRAGSLRARLVRRAATFARQIPAQA